MDMDKLRELKTEVAGIKKIIAFCKKWQKRIEHQLEDDIWSENCEEELDIIKEMLAFCHKRLDEINKEVDDISGHLSRYNHGDYDITCKYYEWFFHTSCLASDDPLPQPTIDAELCKVCELRNCPHYPLHLIGSERR